MALSLIDVLDFAVAAAAIAVLLLVAWRDFQVYRITNVSVLVLIGLALASLVLDNGVGLTARLAVTGILFTLGFVFWLLGLMGAGDAKLFLPIGLLLEWDQLMIFAIALLVLSFMAALVVVLPIAKHANRPGLIGRLAEIKQTGMFPFGVPIALAAIIAMMN